MHKSENLRRVDESKINSRIGVIKPLLWNFLIVFLQNYEKRYLHLIFFVLQKTPKKRNVRKVSTILLVKKRRNEKLRQKTTPFCCLPIMVLGASFQWLCVFRCFVLSVLFCVCGRVGPVCELFCNNYIIQPLQLIPHAIIYEPVNCTH